MKNTMLILIFILFGITCYSQDGGSRSLKTKSSNIIHSDITGDDNVLIKIDSQGRESKLFIDNNAIYLDGDTLKLDNLSVQTLTGTSPTWNADNGVNAKIILTGNTIITLSNLKSGRCGNLTVINASSSYSITFAGYVNKIHPSIKISTNTVNSSGGGSQVVDSYSWRFDSTYLVWNGGKGYN